MLQLIESLPSPWRDAVLGALIGDALGVPHEFKAGHVVPTMSQIHMVMPAGYPKTYDRIPYGTWSDDGSQLLGLLEALHHGKGQYQRSRFLANLQSWLKHGWFQAGGIVFDCGGQTRAALASHDAGEELLGFSQEHCGNGSLMRVLPVAAMPDAYGVSKDMAISIAIDQSCVTHPQWVGQVCCALYVELCWLLQEDWPAAQSTVHGAGEVLRDRKILPPEGIKALAKVLAHGSQNLPTGSGYVVNTLWAAVWALSQGKSLSEVVRRAISLGDDTDTIACVAGGLAVLVYGIDPLARSWSQQMTYAAPAK